MAMFRVMKDKDSPYVMLNKTFLYDENLSLKAKGLLAYLLSLPDDWQIYENEVVKHHSDGKDSLKSAIKDLVKNGYIERQRERDKFGRLGAYEYRVYEVSVQNGKSYVGKTNVGKTYVGKSASTNNDLTNNNLTNNYVVVVEAYTNAKGKSPTKAEKDKLIELSNNYSEELILKAIDMTVEQAEHFNLKYIRSILESFKAKGLNTLQEVETWLTNENRAVKKSIEDKRERLKNKPKRNGEIDFNNGSNLFNGYKNKRTIEDIKRDMGIET